MLIETHADTTLDEQALRTYLATRIAHWWMPDLIFFEPVPLTATGKIDKKVIRDRHGDALRHR